MGKNERQAYLKAIRPRYWRARKKVKVTILDEFCAVNSLPSASHQAPSLNDAVDCSLPQVRGPGDV